MLFNSLSFAIFFPIVFALYWFVARRNLKWQNLLLLVSSYYFYSCWDWRFLFLLMFSTLLDFYTGIKMQDAEGGRKKFWFWLSVSINLGFLGVFKYYNFFAQSFADLLHGFGVEVHPGTLDIILPVGISFYTFHGLSYVIDIYKNRIPAERNFVEYAVFVSFFPLLVAGPIERATHLLPQIQRERVFDYSRAKDGMRQILWGLFKKMVIADNCADLANTIFADPSTQSGSSLLLGAIFFTFQIYGDFSGYSDIALGTARLFGIELLRNFAFPYFSRDIAEFWRRWHISLSSWFRDYLYIPLGGSKGGKWMQVRNTFIIFLVSGFWHGANWTFIAWGFIHALYFIPLLLINRNRQNMEIVAQGKWLPSIRELISMGVTFALVVIGWIFFRAQDLTHAFEYLHYMFKSSLISFPSVIPYHIVLLVVFMVIVEWLGREGKYALEHIEHRLNKVMRWGVYFTILFLISMYLKTEETPFIYFQF
jgi:alginate O-acetyltransferase complex protein AlgI